MGKDYSHQPSRAPEARRLYQRHYRDAKRSKCQRCGQPTGYRNTMLWCRYCYAWLMNEPQGSLAPQQPDRGERIRLYRERAEKGLPLFEGAPWSKRV